MRLILLMVAPGFPVLRQLLGILVMLVQGDPVASILIFSNEVPFLYLDYMLTRQSVPNIEIYLMVLTTFPVTKPWASFPM